MADWPYNTSTWRNLREAKLRASPMCGPCRMRGQLVQANTVDHVRSIASGGDPFPPLSGLMSMCSSCHSSKTAAVDRKGGNGVAFKGTDASGMPVDPSHPFYGGGGDTPSKDKQPRAPDRPGSRIFTKFRGRR